MHSLGFSALFYIFTKYLIWPDVGFIIALAECFDYENVGSESPNEELKTGVLPFDSTWTGLDPECAEFLVLSWFFLMQRLTVLGDKA